MTVVPACQGWGKAVATKGHHKGVLGVMELFCVLIMVADTQIYTCVKLHGATHEKASFTVC